MKQPQRQVQQALSGTLLVKNQPYRTPATNLAVQQSLSEIFEDFTVFITEELRYNTLT